MTKPEQGKHARAKQRVKAAALLTPAVLTGAAVAFTVAAYQPLVYDPNSIAKVAQAQAQELQTAEAISEKQVANDPVIESNFGMEIGTLNDGTYTGSARGYKSVITVSVTISGGKITAITVVSAGDDEPYFSNARAVIQWVLSSQSMNVDTVSGATYSSTGILMAIKNALLQAAGKAPQAVAAPIAQAGATHAPASDVQAPTGTMKDGEYTGRGIGFNDYITVAITVEGGKITSVSIVDEDDDEPYFSNAKSGVVPRILTNQNSQVDAVSGATYSSKGIMAAVADAMTKAVAANNAASGAGGGTAGGNDGGGDAGGSDAGGSGDPSTPGNPEQPGNPADPSKPSTPAEQPKYLDGEYTAYAYCADASRPDRYEPYYVALTVVVADGKVSAIKDVHGSATGAAGSAQLNPYDTENDEYLDYAVNGRVRKGTTCIGVVNQLLAGKRSADVDAVTGATYSSRAIAKAYDAALEMAAQAYEGKQKEETASGGGAAGAGNQAGAGAGAGAEAAAGSQGAAGNVAGMASALQSGSAARASAAPVSAFSSASLAGASWGFSPITPGRWW